MRESAAAPHLDSGLEPPQPDLACASLCGGKETSTRAEANASDGLCLARGQLVHVLAAMSVEDLRDEPIVRLVTPRGRLWRDTCGRQSLRGAQVVFVEEISLGKYFSPGWSHSALRMPAGFHLGNARHTIPLPPETGSAPCLKLLVTPLHWRGSSRPCLCYRLAAGDNTCESIVPESLGMAGTNVQQ
jgi:hypothetical protein